MMLKRVFARVQIMITRITLGIEKKAGLQSNCRAMQHIMDKRIHASVLVPEIFVPIPTHVE
ncbi:MAG: hypothetical protein B7X39_11600 [Lysobacterales bacterium 14-68-21]|nr:MAG: hypothetical protein B7X45_11635 [Xanthomonadales bacterium 15-68-25]OZB66134.1 MAG: hypothetical protein B7X39_11600 [Xanthomonadales bacterium 14-68-21]